MNILETMFNIVLSIVQVYSTSKSAAPRRMNLKHIPRQHVGLANVAERFNTAIAAQHHVFANLPWLAACHAKGTVVAAVGQDARRHGFQKTHTPDAAVAARPLACAAGVGAYFVAL